MAMSTRSRLSLFLAITALLVAGILGAQTVGARSPRTADGSEPGSGRGSGGIAGICVAPDPQDGAASGPPPFAGGCDDTVDDPVVLDPGDGSVVHDVDDGAQVVQPRPGMAGVRPHIFDHVVANDDGTSLTVYFWSGVEPCYVLDHVDVREGPTEITVTLFEGHDASAGDVACIDIALLKRVVVHLDAPVGDRRILDGAS
jgi:hypothetical protein